ncbi:MAG: metallophosphoesterase [bacterium]|nr:metallophosphoesterase [bacterium]
MTREELNQKKQKKILSEARHKKEKKIFLFLIKILIVLFILGGGFYLLNKYIFTSQIVVKEERISNKKIPSSFNGIKIIQFSDLHYGSTIFIDEVKELVKLINVRNPDLVVFTGDLIDKNYNLKADEQELLIKQLALINSSIGKYAIAGEEDADNFLTIFNQSGFTILSNDYDLIYAGSNDPILLVGVSSKLKQLDDIDKAFSYFKQEVYNANIYTIALVHEGDLIEEINKEYKADLFLAGHSHNNSILYPWGESPYKIEGALKYSEEYYDLGDSKVYVSSGVGTNGNKIRFLTLPSINFFRLSSKEGL